MNTLRLAAFVLLLAGPPLTQAVQPSGPLAPGRAAGDIVERGGTVDAVDLKKPAIVVDGVSYAIPPGSVRIHTTSNQVSTSLSQLKPGMQIRFSSSKDYSSQGSQVREIWVTDPGGRTTRP
jgi:hypothetical protein